VRGLQPLHRQRPVQSSVFERLPTILSGCRYVYVCYFLRLLFMQRYSSPVMIYLQGCVGKVGQVYSTLLYSTLLYSTLLYSTLLYSTLLYSTLLYSTPSFMTHNSLLTLFDKNSSSPSMLSPSHQTSLTSISVTHFNLLTLCFSL
jgi:hypothetical protein